MTSLTKISKPKTKKIVSIVDSKTSQDFWGLEQLSAQSAEELCCC